MRNIFKDISTAYNGIAKYYELWSQGDEAYEPSLNFYVKILSKLSYPMLEVGIGTGRIAHSFLSVLNSRILASKDLDLIMLTGIDNSEEMLKICAERNKKFISERQLRLLCMDICSSRFNFANDFNTVYIPFRTIGHVSKDNISDVFKKIHKALKINGRFLFDHYVFNRQWAEKNNGKWIKMYADENIEIFDQYIYDFHNCVMDCKIRVNGEIIQRFPFRWIEPDEIIGLADKTGFRIESLFGDFNCDNFRHGCANQIWILQKI